MEPVAAATPDPVDRIAAALIEALDRAQQIPPLTEGGELSLPAAYRITAAIRTLREHRGETVIGRKIGFTNRHIWPEYGVYAPIWGYMYHTTCQDAESEGVDLAALVEPRIEPEIVFGLKRAPDPDMDERALLACIEWVAHGIEIVQSMFPGWHFGAADSVAAFGLHGALRLGPRVAVAPVDADLWLSQLPSFAVTLSCNGETKDRGEGRNVLDGPLSALHHLVGLLAADDANPPLVAGEIVSTGTLTRAFPIRAGETWTTAFEGLPLDGLTLSLR